MEEASPGGSETPGSSSTDSEPEASGPRQERLRSQSESAAPRGLAPGRRLQGQVRRSISEALRALEPSGETCDELLEHLEQSLLQVGPPFGLEKSTYSHLQSRF